MSHVMLDIETLSTDVDATIIAVGAVQFDRDGIISDFYMLPSWEGSISHETVRWWFQQSKEAQDAITTGNLGRSLLHCPLKDTLEELIRFIGQQPVWGNGVSFDNAICQYHAKRYGLKWPYRQDRCFRTVKALFANQNDIVKSKMPHHALADAEAQARTLINIAKRGIAVI